MCMSLLLLGLACLCVENCAFSVCCGGDVQLTTLASQALHDKTLYGQKLQINYIDSEQYCKLTKGMRQTSVGLARHMHSVTALMFWLICASI